MKVSIGQHSDRGHKEANQDFYGAVVPRGAQLAAKGAAIALADGIGSSTVSHEASEFAVRGILEDYYCTSEAWSVKKSVERVMAATNSWLHSRTQQSPWRYDQDRGYVCTLSALVLKGRTAHLFHVGDSRIYRVQGGTAEPLTTDHRAWVSGGQSYLSRAMGFQPRLEIDYRALALEEGDVFVLATDGVHEHVDEAFIAAEVARSRDDLDAAARAIAQEALRRGSADNLTVQVVAVDGLPAADAAALQHEAATLAPPPLLEPRAVLDGWRIVRSLHQSHRSHVYLAQDESTGAPVVLKAPSVDVQTEPGWRERFLMEEWIARRIDSPHVLKAATVPGARSHLYSVMEYVEGQTLAQWMIDHPRPDLEAVRRIVEQVARGLQAFHRMEMVHQDLRPANILIDATGTVKIIDFGAVRVAGLAEMDPLAGEGPILGTAQYSAPEYFLGAQGTARSDLYSLGTIAYQMLCGRLPYGAQVPQARTVAAQRKLRYQSVLGEDRDIPVWIDAVLRKAVHPDPLRRHEALSEFVHELRHPTATTAGSARAPLAQQHPVVFWKAVSALLGLAVLALLYARP